MGQILSLTISSSVFMLAMYLIYKWVLASENTHSYNRGIILSIYVLSPLFAIMTRWGQQSMKTTKTAISDVTTSDLLDLLILNSGNDSLATITENAPLWSQILIGVWLLGIMFLTLYTIIGFIKVSNIARNGEKHTLNGHYRLVITEKSNITPFSTRKSIIISRDDYNSAKDLIIAHEMGHIAKKHWFDLLLSKIVTIICWFNPAAWLIAEELKSVHEYQADYEVLRGGVDIRKYQMLLIKKAVGKSFPAIANSLNHSKLKKRITMMLKSKQCKGRKLRALALVPAAAGALLVTNIPAVATCLATVSQSSLSTPQTVREVNEKVETKTQAVKESSMPTTVDAVETETKTDNNARTQNVNSKNAPQTDMGEKHLKNIGNDTMSLKTAETLPSFVGGDKAMFEWLIQNIEYPDVNLADQPETIRVIVKFIVDKNGNAIDPEIVRGGPEAYNQAAINVVNKMPTWEPGRIDGEPANVTFTLPINFKTKKDTPKAE